MDATSWDDRYAGSGFVWTTEPNRFLPPAVDGLAVGSALDLACGEGRNAVWLATRGWDATGVDFSSVGLDKAAQLADANGVTDRTRWVCADATSWQPDAAFDLVVVFYLHLPERERRAAFGVAASALAPGGIVLVVGHDSSNLTDGVGGPPDPAVLYGPDEVVGDLLAAVPNLDIARAERVRRPVVVDDGDGGSTERDAIDCLVLARRQVEAAAGS